MKILRALPLTFILIAAICWCNAQPGPDFVEWGKVTLQDLKLDVDSFAKDADAVLLCNYENMYFDHDKNTYYRNLDVKTAIYQRYKILSEKGTARASFRFSYVTNSSAKITGIKAICYNLGANGEIEKTELKPAEIYTTKLNSYLTEVAFAIPAVKKGSVFEVTYVQGHVGNYSLPGWSFNAAVPVIQSRLRIGFIDAMIYHTQSRINNVKVEAVTKSFKATVLVGMGTEFDGRETTFTANNVSAVPDEPYMNCRENYENRLDFQIKDHSPFWTFFIEGINSYPEFEKLIMGHQLTDNLDAPGIPKQQWQSVINENMTPVEKVKAIFELVRNHMEWNNVTTAFGGGQNNWVWKDKKGSSAEINVLLISILKKAGIDAKPALVPARASGYPCIDYPMYAKFKSMLAYVDLGKGETYLLDASDRFLPFGLTRYDALNNYVYILGAEGKDPWHETFDQGLNTEVITVMASLDTLGIIKGDIKLTFNNYMAAQVRQLKSVEHIDSVEKTKPEYLSNIEKIKIEEQNDSIDEVNRRVYKNIKFSKEATADNEGNLYFALTDIYGHAENPFTSKKRVSDVDLAYKRKQVSTLMLTVPANYVVDSLIQPTAYITPDTSIKFVCQTRFDNGVLYITQKIEYLKSFYPVTEYPDFYEFHQKYYKLIEQPVVIRKKQ